MEDEEELELVSAEEFFGGFSHDIRTGKTAGAERQNGKDLLEEIKIKMIQRLYKLNREDACAYISERIKRGKEKEDENQKMNDEDSRIDRRARELWRAGARKRMKDRADARRKALANDAE